MYSLSQATGRAYCHDCVHAAYTRPRAPRPRYPSARPLAHKPGSIVRISRRTYRIRPGRSPSAKESARGPLRARRVHARVRAR